MHAHRQRFNLTDDHQLTLVIPSYFPTGSVEVIVLSDAMPLEDKALSQAQMASDLNAFFELLKTVPRSGRTLEQINAQIQEERDAWDR